MARSEVVTFNGVRFRRYPDSKRRSDRVYFTPGSTDKQRGVKRLHEEIWMAENGPIPGGWHIHHKDGDPLNNALDNLACIPPVEHVAEHWTPERAQAAKQRFDEARPLASAWHRSPEGIAWHRKQGAESWRNRGETTKVCEHCGQSFQGVTGVWNTRFCSNKCKSAWRRAQGLDDETRECVVCGEDFRINKYAPTQTCSRKCAGRVQSRTKLSRS